MNKEIVLNIINQYDEIKKEAFKLAREYMKIKYKDTNYISRNFTEFQINKDDIIFYVKNFDNNSTNNEEYIIKIPTSYLWNKNWKQELQN